MYLIFNIDICSLLVRIDCVGMKPEWKLYFLEWKTGSSVLNLVPRTLEITSWGFEIPKFSEGACPQTPLKKGANGPLLIQSVTLFKPAGYFNYYWNPYMLKCSQSKNGSREEAEKNGAGAGNAREVPLPDQAFAVKMAGYWPSSFSAYFMNSQRR